MPRSSLPKCIDQIRAAATERQRRWRMKMRSDPELYAAYKCEERAKAQNRKVKKKLRSINEMTEDEKAIQRQKWRDRQRCSRQRKFQTPALQSLHTDMQIEPSLRHCLPAHRIEEQVASDKQQENFILLDEPTTIIVSPDIQEPTVINANEDITPEAGIVQKSPENVSEVKIKKEVFCCEKCYALCSIPEQACLTIQSLQEQIQALEEELLLRSKCS